MSSRWRLFFIIWMMGLPLGLVPLCAQTPTQHACAGQRVSFPTKIATKLGSIEHWEWNFGDPASESANLSEEREPSHIFEKAGLYHVSLVIQTDRGITDTIVTLVDVHPLPVAGFVLMDSCGRDTMHLAALAPQPSYQYRWYLDDQLLQDSLPVLYHPLKERRSHVVSLYVADSMGCQAMSRQYLRWPLAPSDPNVIGDTVCFGEVATLTGKAAVGSYLEWGTQEKKGAFVPVHTGDTLETDPLSFSQTYYARSVDSVSTCASPPMAALAFVHHADAGRIVYDILRPEELPTEIGFQIQFPVQPEHILWDFENGETSERMQPTHVYEQAGSYEVQAQLQFRQDCEVTITTLLHITQPAVVALPASFSPNGDGHNDSLRLERSAVKSFCLQVYSLSGTLLFETRDPEFVWGGKDLMGKMVQEGIYLCKITGQDQKGNPIDERSSLTIIR